MSMPELSASAQGLHAAIAGRTTLVGIIGLGYVGLPLARAFSLRGFRVLGFDKDPCKVSRLHMGESYVQEVPFSVLGAMLERGFTATADPDRLGEPGVLLLCLPTPLTPAREPDLSAIVSSAEAISRYLRRGQLVVLESTTYPGTTRQVLRPILEKRGLQAGIDFFLAYSPEREDPGNPDRTLENISRVVGALVPVSLDMATALYAQISPAVVRVSSAEVAEACKLLENTYRAVNIALVNELKVLYGRMSIDVWEVIEAAKTKPFGFQAFLPGPGVGGNCIPVNPHYLAWTARQAGALTRLIEVAAEVNADMPRYVVERIGEALNGSSKGVESSRILVLGVAYKKDVEDWRGSPALEIIELLRAHGAYVNYNDPHVPTVAADLQSQPLTEELLAAQDCVVIVTDHSAYDFAWVVRHTRLVVDTRNATAVAAAAPGRCRIWKA